jgi:thiamine kinase-like enzyme
MNSTLRLQLLVACLILAITTALAWTPPECGSTQYRRWERQGLCSQTLSDVDSDKLTELLLAAGMLDNADDVSIESLKGENAFCNTLYRIHGGSRTAIAKLFSPLALARMDPSRNIGSIDRLAAKARLAPSILATTPTSMIMEECAGRLLSEADLHYPDSSAIPIVATALARLHSIEPKPDLNHSRPNMLWRACQVMLSRSSESHTAGGWTVERLEEAVKRHKAELDDLEFPLVATGHGDCKPSNVILTSEGVKFIDLELAGTHYRAFDLAKMLRTDNPTVSTNLNRRLFLKAYARSISSATVDARGLEFEVNMLVPLTWLEAAIFFFCMAGQDPVKAEKWNRLTLDRLNSYEKSMQVRSRLTR